MSSLPRRTLLLLLGLIAGPFFCRPVAAQTGVQSQRQKPTVTSPSDVPVPPPSSTLKSPVDIFRQLLAMSDQQRELFLTNRTAETRQRLLAKVNEYQVMKPDERELRLRATQLRWYLLRFMNEPAVNRMAQLSLVPDPADRQFLEYRLQLWDDLTPQQQKDVLEYETAVHYLQPSASHTNEINTLSGKQRDELDRKMGALQALPDGQREQMYTHFQKFFELTDDEKQKALRSLPETERQQIDKTLKSFARLPKEKRDKCISSFQKFAGMSEVERQQFLRNAERWKEMTPAERESWRNLVARLPALPPLPPGLSTPPMPPTVHRRHATPPPPLVTNGVQ